MQHIFFILFIFSSEILFMTVKCLFQKESWQGRVYQIQIGLLEEASSLEERPKAKIKLTNGGVTNDGWYTLGSIEVIH